MAKDDAPKPPGRDFRIDGSVLPATSLNAPMPKVQPPKPAAPVPPPASDAKTSQAALEDFDAR